MTNGHRRPDLAGRLLAVGRILLGGVFLYASWDKILDPVAFAAVVANYQILPPALVNVAALGLPWFELVCGLGLVTNFWMRGSALIVTMLMAVFMAALGYSAYRGIDFTCGCFTLTGEAPKSIWIYLLRDLVLLALAATLLIHSKAQTPIKAIFNAGPGSQGDANGHAD